MSREFALTVVMPALNEEDNVLSAIERTLSAFDHLGIDGEIVVINDGSTDNTGNLVATRVQEEQRVRMVVHDTPQGIGASFWDGVRVARGAGADRGRRRRRSLPAVPDEPPQPGGLRRLPPRRPLR